MIYGKLVDFHPYLMMNQREYLDIVSYTWLCNLRATVSAWGLDETAGADIADSASNAADVSDASSFHKPKNRHWIKTSSRLNYETGLKRDL